ncbi:MAG: class I SAM-dependent methyltransferase [Desulfobacteraceae bacterium]|nr:class I SAM-dependent methyltransferase [Desulfobacteraceae bacterium]MBC2752750.1 class I SAM-dependent methyltransferase [Desulfobacteraceae bacterium]
MSTSDFNGKVKRHVAKNFDQSIQIYQQFEEKHHFFRDLTLKLADRIVIKERSSILDIGCGCGISAKALNDRLGCKVLGVDLSHEMVTAGIALCAEDDIRLLEGDGEHLLQIVGDRRFDYALYNASIFIFPDVSRTIDEAYNCLKTGGKIAFSFYPQLVGQGDEDLLDVAFHRLGEFLPRFRVITDYPQASEALAHRCSNICHHRWVRPLDIPFLQDFFSIPAQSASLFPGVGYDVRRNLVKNLFATLEDKAEKGRIVWRMAESIKLKA